MQINVGLVLAAVVVGGLILLRLSDSSYPTANSISDEKLAEADRNMQNAAIKAWHQMKVEKSAPKPSHYEDTTIDELYDWRGNRLDMLPKNELKKIKLLGTPVRLNAIVGYDEASVSGDPRNGVAPERFTIVPINERTNDASRRSSFLIPPEIDAEDLSGPDRRYIKRYCNIVMGIFIYNSENGCPALLSGHLEYQGFEGGGDFGFVIFVADDIEIKQPPLSAH